MIGENTDSAADGTAYGTKGVEADEMMEVNEDEEQSIGKERDRGAVCLLCFFSNPKLATAAAHEC